MRNRSLKQMILMAIMAGIMLKASAVAPGFYMGVMLGPATNSASSQQAQVEGTSTTPPTTVTATPKSQQFGSRIYMGYMINRYAGFEGGATYFSGIRYDSGNVPTCSSANSRVRDLEAVVKGVLPLRQFDVFGKAGVAVAYQTNGGAFNPTPDMPCGRSTYFNKFVPTFSLGASYDWTQNWVTDFTIQQVMVGGKVGSMTMFAVGVAYHFVDVYCGQFLC